MLRLTSQTKLLPGDVFIPTGTVGSGSPLNWPIIYRPYRYRGRDQGLPGKRLYQNCQLKTIDSVDKALKGPRIRIILFQMKNSGEDVRN